MCMAALNCFRQSLKKLTSTSRKEKNEHFILVNETNYTEPVDEELVCYLCFNV